MAAAYEEKAERDQEALERLVFYAQTGFCRWRVLLEYFDEPMEGEHCGHCDNCLQPPVQRVVKPQEPIAMASLHAAPFKAGDEVRVPRYGDGRVEQVAGDEVKVVFPDGAKRSFVAQVVLYRYPREFPPGAPPGRGRRPGEGLGARHRAGPPHAGSRTGTNPRYDPLTAARRVERDPRGVNRAVPRDRADGGLRLRWE